MKQTKKYTAGFVMLDRRVNAMNRVFNGNGIAFAIFFDLVTRMSHEEAKKKLKSGNQRWVPINRMQCLTSYRTLMRAHGFTKHEVTKAIKHLEENQMIQIVKCSDMPGLTNNDGIVVTILRGGDFGTPPDTSSDEINNTTTKGDEITTRNECIAQLQQAVKNKAAYVDGICIDSIVDIFLAKIEGGSPYKSWRSGLVTFCRNQRKWDAEAAAKNTSYSPKIVAKPTKGKGPEALFEMDCKAGKRNAA